MCHKKRLSKLKAQMVVAESVMKQTRGNKKREESRFYFCGSCKSYHTTSQPKR